MLKSINFTGNDSEWIDITDAELHKIVHKTNPGGKQNGRVSDNHINHQTPHLHGQQMPIPHQQQSNQQHQQHQLQQLQGMGSQPKLGPVMGTANLGLNRGVAGGNNNSRRSLVRRDSLVATPPLPPLSPEGSPVQSPATSPARQCNQYQRSYR